MLRGVVSVSLRAPGEKGAGGAAAVSSVNGRGDGTHKRAVPGSRAECREAQDPAQSPVHPSIRSQQGAQAQQGAALPLNTSGPGGGGSQLLGRDQIILGRGSSSRAGCHRGVSMQGAGQDLGSTFLLLLLPQIPESLCSCFLYFSLVHSTKPS